MPKPTPEEIEQRKAEAAVKKAADEKAKTEKAEKAAPANVGEVTALSGMVNSLAISASDSSLTSTALSSSSSSGGENDSASSPPTTIAVFSTEVTEVHEPDNLAIAYLEKHDIESKSYAHQAAFTCEEQEKILSQIPGQLTKNLFLKDKRYGLFLVTACDTRDVNMKLLHKMLGLSGANLRLADEQILMENLGVVRGSVSPLALINDIKNQVQFYVDKDLYESAVINVHPLRNDRTTSLSNESFKKFILSTKRTPIVLDFNNASL